MAFGKHWEWRGFGELAPELRKRIESLPLKFPAAQDLTDEYLWVPGSPVNLKLRFSDLKFKRLLATEDGLERWLEDPAENYPLPVEPPVLRRLCEDLSVRLPSLPAAPVGREELLGLLAASQPRVQLVSVVKSRWQRDWSGPEAPGERVTVELARIKAPEATWSVGVEHPERAVVAAVRDALGLERHLRRESYLQALARWAR